MLGNTKRLLQFCSCLNMFLIMWFYYYIFVNFFCKETNSALCLSECTTLKLEVQSILFFSKRLPAATGSINRRENLDNLEEAGVQFFV